MVLIDTVYQRVLALANKEQRGYITPQEFNLLANQAQKLIFEQYFYDIEKTMMRPGNDSEYGDRLDILNEKIAPFQKTSSNLTYSAAITSFALPTSTHKLGTVIYGPSSMTYPVEVEELRENELLYINSSPISRPKAIRPIYTKALDENFIRVQPTTIVNDITCTYVMQPVTAIWGYAVVNSQAMYDNTMTVNFELHPSEENELVYKILELAGITLNKPGLVQIATSEETAMQQLKQ
jgi:hypothetical protein